VQLSSWLRKQHRMSELGIWSKQSPGWRSREREEEREDCLTRITVPILDASPLSWVVADGQECVMSREEEGLNRMSTIEGAKGTMIEMTILLMARIGELLGERHPSLMRLRPRWVGWL